MSCLIKSGVCLGPFGPFGSGIIIQASALLDLIFLQYPSTHREFELSPNLALISHGDDIRHVSIKHPWFNIHKMLFILFMF